MIQYTQSRVRGYLEELASYRSPHADVLVCMKHALVCVVALILYTMPQPSKKIVTVYYTRVGLLTMLFSCFTQSCDSLCVDLTVQLYL